MIIRDYKKDYQLDYTFMIISNELPYHRTAGYWEFPIVTEGTVYQKMDNKTEKLVMGDACLLRPNVEHTYSRCEGSYRIINIMITDNGLHELTSVLAPSIYNFITNFSNNVKLSISNSAIDEFSNTVYKIQKSYNDNPETFSIFLKLMWMDAIKHVYQYCLNSQSNYPDWLNSFLATIKDPKNLTLPINELYKFTHFSHSHLIKLFKQYTGQTLKSYMQHIKMNHAAKLLQSSDRKIVDIAVEIGYNSLSHFNKSFKDFYHTTPSNYRNKRKGQT